MKIAGPLIDSTRPKSRKKWMLDYYVPVALTTGGSKLQRFRPHYLSRELAAADRQRLLEQYVVAGVSGRVGVLSRDQVEDYELARLEAPEATMLELARFWRLHRPLQAAKKISELIPVFLEWVKSRLGEKRHYSDLKSRLDLFAKVFGARLAVTVTREEFLSWLLGLKKKGRTVLNQKRAVVNFFNWLVHEAKVLTTNQLGGIKKRSLPKALVGEIVYLELAYVARYLRACERYDPDLVAHEIVQLGGGVRADDEMADFRGEFVQPQTRTVVIPAAIAKTERREVIDNLEGNFWDWWKVYGREGVLRAPNYEQRWKRVRVLAVVEDRAHADELARLPIKTLLARPESKAALKAWPWNARRRTFCTYKVAKDQSAEAAALILRHRGDAETLHNSYRGMGVTQPQGVAYFEIRPNPVPFVIWPARPHRGIVRLQRARLVDDRPALAS